jgi:hypothetical protein
MPRVTDQKTRQFLLVTGTELDPEELPEKLEIYDVEGAPLSIPRGGRRTITQTTASLAAAVDTGKLVTRVDGGAEDGVIDLDAYAVMLSHISVDKPARVRLYTTAAKRDADAGRDRYTDPMNYGGADAVPDHGCLAEFILLTTLSLEVIPADYLRTADTTGTLIYYRIANFDLSAGAVTVTLTAKDMEG